jgi:hypothetical protein
MLTRLVNGPAWQSQPTYRWEFLLAGLYLALVATVTTDWDDARQTAGQLVGAVAVFASFGHMSVAARLEEAQDRSDVKTVECYRKLTRYLVAKEALWLAAFTLLRAWTALAGIPLFLLYPAWRRVYLRVRQPTIPTETSP